MTNYEREAIAPTLKGIITIGANEGYDKPRFLLEDVTSTIHKINEEYSKNNLDTIPCIITEGLLIGRSTKARYQEKVFSINFLWSPRSRPLTKEVFHERLLGYAEKIGALLKQERVYIEFDGKIEVLKINRTK